MRLFLIAGLFLNLIHPLDATAAVTHDEVRNVINAFNKAMNPWMKENRNGKVNVLDQWESDDLTGGGAGARGLNNSWTNIQIHLTGAFDRAAATTENTVAFALCHELGHLTAQVNTHSGEQLADTFAVTTCLPLVFENYALTQTNSPTELELQFCKKNLKDKSEINSCARALKASIDAAIYRYNFWIADRIKCSKPDYSSQAKSWADGPLCGLNIAESIILKQPDPVCLDYSH